MIGSIKLLKNKCLSSNDKGLILFAHGSRNPAWRKPFDRMVRDLKRRGHPHTVLAFGEFMSPDVAQAAQRLVAKGVKQAVIVPLFLGGGLHVRGDLPRLAAQARLASGLKLRVARAICEDAAVLAAIADYCAASAAAKPITSSRRKRA
jgi:sirohydrochlorin cobaltochelatase